MTLVSNPSPSLRRRPWDDHDVFRRLREDPDPALRDAVIERFLPLARHLARRHPSGGEREDVLQVAMIGLVKAVDRYDPDHGAAFSSFATPTILGEIKRYFRDLGWAVRVPRELQERAARVHRARDELTASRGRAPTAAELSFELGESLEDVLEALASDTAHYPMPLEPTPRDDDDPVKPLVAVDEPGFARVDAAAEVDGLLDQLPPDERAAIVLRFRDDLLQREIATHLEVSQMQVSRLLSSGLARLQRIANTDTAANAA